MYHCAICSRSFAAKFDLQQHMQHHPDAEPAQVFCETCNWPFDDSLALETHKIQNQHGAPLFPCENCSRSFQTQAGYNKHRQFPSPCSDAFRKKTPPQGHPAGGLRVGPNQSGRPSGYVDLDAAPAQQPSELPYDTSPPPTDITGVFCHGCENSFESEAQFGRHLLWCPATQAAQSQAGSAHDHNMSEPSTTTPTTAVKLPGSLAEASRPIQRQPAEGMFSRLHNAPAAPPLRREAASSVNAPSSIGGPAEIAQANFICGKILRLLIQSDISIQDDGKMICGGTAWTRIGVAKQPEVIGMFDNLCHLPKKLQGEYLPPPKAFRSEYQAKYPVSDFEPSPEQLPSKPGLGVVAISCSKIVLADGRLEVVKIAAIDVISCRILMNHLVCTDPKASVKDWRTSITGVASFQDIEATRQAGYKVLKGWQAARAALWKFVDKETIIVGYNLRSDLDALRMIHGRAVDVAKSVEKAANGPLSKQQLSLESLCRDYPEVHLKADPVYGCDCLQNAFAARELGLWIIKNGDNLVKRAKQKSLDYQRVMAA
ncbi:hypothetical protein BU26DRAFT_413874 [Trematosphaeria pertusa]|uniref:C2H2-type domain-containing protein n=1 Tax=Trematosphaeria pertusa TaxID=390896 RepID=A0A6A6J3G6_9PLEO|nr:uncharacterized protein BU26DRAFT_413874 [Trematosphaeria pertusa]KAF2257176.1 hypothetical protein BU26DRAFT_413874 [Trematosphaeria pertusa]